MTLIRSSKPGKIGIVLQTLGQEISQGVFEPGSRLPSEPELEVRFGASRSVIREAVKTLSAKGLVVVGPRHGTRVRPRGDWSMLDRDVLQWLTSATQADPELSKAIDEVRAIIEPAASAMAAERASLKDIARIRTAFEAMQQAAVTGEIATAIQADKDFHLAILLATHNPILMAFDTAIDSILGVLFHTAVNHLDNFKANLPRHGDVLEAIERKSPSEASAAMTAVIEFTRENMRKNHLYGKPERSSEEI